MFPGNKSVLQSEFLKVFIIFIVATLAVTQAPELKVQSDTIAHFALLWFFYSFIFLSLQNQ